MSSDKGKNCSLKPVSASKQEVLAGYFDDLLKLPDESDEANEQSNAEKTFVSAFLTPDEPSTASKAVNEEYFEQREADASLGLSSQDYIVEDKKTEKNKKIDYQSLEKICWEADNFDVLLVKLNEASIAIPLLLIGSVYKCESPLVHIANQASWFLGLYRHSEQTINVLDTQQLVSGKFLDAGEENQPAYVLTIAGSQYGLACSGVEKVVKLKKQEVRWREGKVNKQWYRGILIEQMCILLDVQKLMEERGI